MSNNDIVRRFYEVIVSENLLDELPRYVAEDCAQVVGGKKTVIGLEGMRQHLAAVRRTYPDYTMRITRQYEDGDTVISEFLMRGTHEGEFIGIAPTGKVIEISGIDIDKVVDGRIIEHGGATNTFEAFWENGLIAPA